MRPVIKIEQLSKAYHLGAFGSGSISLDLSRYLARIRGKEDPFLKIGEENDRAVTGKSNVVWSLKDISFDIVQGESVGIIGRNGAGKSTLLKILSRVTGPTSGTVKLKGRVASLLEVGTGFHPELSGRENIFLNGAILGMRKSEIKRKFDEIVEFSGVGRYIDTPVKRYSSGMYVRLAFSVAAHLDSEILIVDEVLSVGDAEFQKKCLGKMGEVSKTGGRTVLFVSHNMGAIKSLCHSAVVLNNGRLLMQGSVDQAIKSYTGIQTVDASVAYTNTSDEATFKEIKIQGIDKTERLEFSFDEQIFIQLSLNITPALKQAFIGFKVSDNLERVVFVSEKPVQVLTAKPGIAEVTVTIPESILTPGAYRIDFAAHIPNITHIEIIENKFFIDILETGTTFYRYQGADYGCVFVDCKWYGQF